MKDKFNENLREARLRKRLTQQQVADRYRHALADKVDPMALKAVSAFQQTFQVE